MKLKTFLTLIVAISLLVFFQCGKQNGMKDSTRLKGELIVKVKKANQSEWKTVVHKKNLVVNTGIAQVAGLINGTATGEFSYIAIGSGTTAPSATDTALQNELARGDATESRVTTDTTNDTAQWVYTFTATSSWAVSEAGVFNASSGGTMLNRVTFSTINLAQNDQLQVTFKLDVD